MGRPKTKPAQLRKPANRLTPKQDRFAREFVVDLNIAAASRRAGISGRYGIGLFGKQHFHARVAELQAERNERVRIDADFVLRRLAEEVNADARDLYDESGNLLPVRQWPEVWRRGLVSSIRTVELYERDATGKNVAVGVMKDVVLVDRARRLELFGRHIKVGAFSDKVTVGLDSPLQQLFAEISGNVIRPATERARLIEHQPVPPAAEEG